jgi:hypothetical protein
MESALIELQQMDVDTIACGVPTINSVTITTCYIRMRKKQASTGGVFD